MFLWRSYLWTSSVVHVCLSVRICPCCSVVQRLSATLEPQLCSCSRSFNLWLHAQMCSINGNCCLDYSRCLSGKYTFCWLYGLFAGGFGFWWIWLILYGLDCSCSFAWESILFGFCCKLDSVHSGSPSELDCRDLAWRSSVGARCGRTLVLCKWSYV